MSSSSHCVIVIPCYNESRRLPVAEIEDFLHREPYVSLLMVDDGSQDQTLEVLASLQDSRPSQISVLALPENQGKAEAVRQGMLAANQMGCHYVGFWDADMATPLEAVPQFAAALDQSPRAYIAWGTRLGLMGRTINRHPLRRVLGKIFSTASAIAVSLPIRDALCGAKLFRRGPLVEQLFGCEFRSRWIFDVEILARLRMLLSQFPDQPASEVLYEMPLNEWSEIEGSRLRLRDFVRAGMQIGALAVRSRLGRIELPPIVEPTLAGEILQTVPFQQSSSEVRKAA